MTWFLVLCILAFAIILGSSKKWPDLPFGPKRED